MFERLSNKLLNILSKIRGSVFLTEENISDALNEIRKSLLDADVALPVVHNFINVVKKNVIGQEIKSSLTPGQELIKIIRNSLISAMGGKDCQYNDLNLFATPSVIMIVGLQGSGKTTSLAKIGKFLKEKKHKKVLVVSTDIYRPAGIKQLELLSNKCGIDCFISDLNQKSIDIANLALNEAKIKSYDVLLVDTTGCMQFDKKVMSEFIQIRSLIKPVETLFVIDSMLGQDAANVASVFNQELPLTGVVLTKVDSDARGGAAFSIYYITKKPIKFIGVGEDVNALELFYPERLVGRILGMGDVISLIEDIESKVDKKQAEKLIDKVKSGDDFNLFDFMNQLKQMRHMGGIVKIINKFPGVSYLPENLKSKIDDKFLYRMEVIIDSMTIQERNNPSIIKDSRKRRIALGSGVKVKDVNKLLHHFFEVQKIVKKINKHGISKMMHILHSKIFSGFSNKS